MRVAISLEVDDMGIPQAAPSKSKPSVTGATG